MISVYRCPVCKLELDQGIRSLSCPKKHSYDVAREGYVNLLLVNQKNSKEPGDNKLMVEKRRAFLECGFYDQFAAKLFEMISKEFEVVAKKGAENFEVLDVGCGEGYYDLMLLNFLDKSGLGQFSIWGIDISKVAVQKAAKKAQKNTALNFCIGSSFDLPYADESMDLVFSIFAPFDPAEIERVLKKGGKVICVRAGEQHLQELGRLIYDSFKLQSNPLDLAEFFTIPKLDEQRVEYSIALQNNQQLMNLVGMTPYFWHLNDEKKAALEKIEKLQLTVDFKIAVFQK